MSFASAPPPTLGPSISVSLLLSAVKSADLGCGAGSDLVTLGRSLRFPPPSGSLAPSCSQWSSGALLTTPPAPTCPALGPHLLFPAPTPGLAPLSSHPPSPAPTSPLCPSPWSLSSHQPQMLRFQRESIKQEAQQFRFQSTRLMIKKAASPTHSSGRPPQPARILVPTLGAGLRFTGIPVTSGPQRKRVSSTSWCP